MSFERIAVVGDLHFEPCDAEAFDAARRQLLARRPGAVFQLGDQGGYSHCGSWQSFEEGRAFLDGFDLPAYTILGNHDLEGAEYDTDADAIAAWCRALGMRRPYRAVELGEALAVCLSTTAWRENPYSAHEVVLEEEQIAWLRATLAAHRDRPTFVFSHAPVIGSGLRVLQSVHLRVPNAWLNHRHNPVQFRDLVLDNPQIKLWFSAHDHLGQDYADSVAPLGNCVCVHTGVIGPVSRDGTRQSRFVEFNADGWRLSTIDHLGGSCRADATHDYRTGQTTRVAMPRAPNEVQHFAPPPMPTDADRLQIADRVFTQHRGMVVEYLESLAAPIGVVCEGLTTEQVRVVGDELHVVGSSNTVHAYRANEHGDFGEIYAPNTWRQRRRSA
ncbi:MAG TPA: metallophosphoesterase [Pirellulales bacterium]|jgi:3',5'-cyclic AMP phosphodiesterase CpdA|nr:metallophosphoesterase [Pirellulales bacterium]